MREYVSNGHDWIVKALRTSEELEVDEAGENARRRTEVQPPKGQFERSIYAVSQIIEVSTNVLIYGTAERVW
jgi:lupus La protein